MKLERMQEEYYECMANSYDDMHVDPRDEHYRALQYISCFLTLSGVSSVLDVGCGTGRGLRYFLQNYPHIRVNGVEPVKSLVEQATHRNAVPPSCIVRARGEVLPFAENSFDASCELGVLHHVRQPAQVVREMMRVSKKAIFLSDENRFAHGTRLVRLAKLGLYKLGIFRGAYLLKTLGRGYRFSREDGLAYSYSVFDSFELLSTWADTIILVPTDIGKPQSWFHPLMTSFHVLLCAFRTEGN